MRFLVCHAILEKQILIIDTEAIFKYSGNEFAHLLR